MYKVVYSVDINFKGVLFLPFLLCNTTTYMCNNVICNAPNIQQRFSAFLYSENPTKKRRWNLVYFAYKVENDFTNLILQLEENHYRSICRKRQFALYS